MFKYSARLTVLLYLKLSPLALAGEGKVTVKFSEGTCVKYAGKDCYYGDNTVMSFNTAKDQVETNFIWYGPAYEPTNDAEKKDTNKSAWEQKCNVSVKAEFNGNDFLEMKSGQERGITRMLNSPVNLQCTNPTCHVQDKCVGEYIIPIMDTVYIEPVYQVSSGYS